MDSFYLTRASADSRIGPFYYCQSQYTKTFHVYQPAEMTLLPIKYSDYTSVKKTSSGCLAGLIYSVFLNYELSIVSLLFTKSFNLRT